MIRNVALLALVLFGALLLEQCTGLDPQNFPCTDDSQCRNLACICGTCQPKGTTANCNAPEGTAEITKENDKETTIENNAEPPGDRLEPPTENTRDADAAPEGAEPQPEPPPQEIPGDQAACQNGTSRACYTGPPSTAGKGECREGIQTCGSSQWGPCTGEIKPATETCDGRDNDCDGSIDETDPQLGKSCTVTGAKGPCADGKGTCKNGILECVSSYKPVTEKCGDQIDNNCSGTADEGCGCTKDDKRVCYTAGATTQGVGLCKAGQQTCGSNGKWGTCIGEVTPQKEQCDGKDNDCNGQIDNIPPGPCNATGSGECAKGTTNCVRGREICEGKKSATEICDGLDNDCDGMTDEGLGEVSCTDITAKGECRKGSQSCKAGTSTCQPGPKRTEICHNKLDEDCDGTSDNGCVKRSYSFIVVRRGGTVSHSRGITRVNTSPSTIHELSANGYHCENDGVPLFISPLSTELHIATYDCKGAIYRVRISSAIKATPTAAPNPGDVAFIAVLPVKASTAEPWTFLKTVICVGANCSVSKQNTNTTAIKIAKSNISGTYTATHPNCTNKETPFFVSIRSDILVGYVAAHSSQAKTNCEFRTYRFDGVPQPGMEVGLWLPDPQGSAWAMIRSSMSISSQQSIGQTNAWSITRGNTPPVHRVKYVGDGTGVGTTMVGALVIQSGTGFGVSMVLPTGTQGSNWDIYGFNQADGRRQYTQSMLMLIQ